MSTTKLSPEATERLKRLQSQVNMVVEALEADELHLTGNVDASTAQGEFELCDFSIKDRTASVVPRPLFEQHSLTTFKRAQATFVGRGAEYGDTWRECRFVKMQAVAKALGVDIPPMTLRALATAAFLDMKYWRNLGGYKDDSLIDEMNYDAFLAEEMKQLIALRDLPPITCS